MKAISFEQTQGLFRTEIGNLFFLFLLALVVRLIALDRIYLISRDGIHYVSLAQLYWSGSFFEGLAHPFHPLYPAIMGLVGGIIGDFELAGKLISLTLSCLTIIPLYLIGRSFYDSKVGFIGGLLFIFQPYCVRFSVDVLSDSTFLFFFVFSLYLGLKALREEKNNIWWSLGAGISAGLAYLTRPEGMVIVVFLLGWYGWELLVCERKGVERVSSIALATFLAFFLFALPYTLFIKSHTGNWHISMKPSITKSFQVMPPETGSENATSSVAPQPQRQEGKTPTVAPAKPRASFQGGDVWRSLTNPLLKFIETFHYLLFLFLLIGIWKVWKGEGRPSGGIFLIFLAGYLLGLSYLYYTVSYVSRRHFLPPLSLSLPLAGVGFWAVRERFSDWMGRLNYKWSQTIAHHITLLIILVTVLTLMPKALKSQGIDKLPLKEAALWIKEHGDKPSPVIMSNEPLVAYYAGGKHLYIPGVNYAEFVRYVKVNQVDYLVFEERDITSGERFLSQLRPENFRKAPFKGNNEVMIYKVSG